MKKIFTLLFLLPAFMLGYSQSTTVVISQVYGGGGSSTAGTTYLNDYVELHNISTSVQDISNFSLQYGSATGQFGSTATNIYVFPAGTTIAPGGYFLVQFGTAGTAGAPLPVTPDLITTNLTMSGTNGKVALASQSTALGCGATATPCTLPAANIIDVVAYGSANNFEGSGAVPVLSTTTGAVRKNNGCQDTNNNLGDFDVVTNPVPRNSSSPAFSCGAPTASISAGPSITNLLTTLGVASPERSYTLSGSNLSPAAGNITVTPGANIEVSLTSGGPYTTATLNVPYSAGTLSATPIYVRITSAAPAGAFAGTINNSGGTATAVVVNVTGAVATNYYNTKANLGLTNLGTWSSTPDGTGPSPASFTDPYIYFNIVNSTNANYTGVIDITPTTSRLIIGNGTAPLTFTILPGADSVTSATRVDVLNNATLVIQNNRRPFLNNLATGSTVDFAQTGVTSADTIRVPAISFYNLKLSSGLKYFASGTLTVRGNFVADAVVSMNGALTPFTTINALGDVTFQNGAAFEPLPSGDAARLTLKMNGPGPTHNLNSNGTDVLIFRLQRDSTAACTVNTGANTILTLGNATSGGLLWGSATATPVLNLAANTMTIRGGAVVTNTALGKIDAADATINILKSAGTTHAGTLRFVTDATLANFTVNLDPAVARDSILVADDVFISGTLTLTKGKVVMAAGKVLNMNAGSAVSGGNLLSFVDGTMAKFGNTDFAFPVGKGAKFAPAGINGLSGTGNFTVNYFNTGYGTYTIDPVTLGTYPNYEVSSKEYWNINRTNGISAFVTLSYTDATSNIFVPSAIRVAHNDLTDWDDLGGLPNAGNTTTSGLVTTLTPVTNFGPFTFSAIAAGVLPVSISNFNVVKQNSAAKISWTTQQETNSREFVVERSSNGLNWTAIKTVAAAGSSSTAINYSVLDESPLKGYNYYRLRMLDMDNKATQTGVKKLYFSQVYSIAVSPNPATDFIKVDVSGNSGKAYTVSVTDASGKKVYEIKSSNAFVNIPASRLNKGVYMVTVTDEGNTLVQKVVLQ